jgi:brefeldin A-inhibited guanine nucleotide-exchange protein
MQYLLDSNCIPSRTPKDIAYFLLHNDGLNKTMIGEFLGEGYVFVDNLSEAFLTLIIDLAKRKTSQ